MLGGPEVGDDEPLRPGEHPVRGERLVEAEEGVVPALDDQRRHGRARRARERDERTAASADGNRAAAEQAVARSGELGIPALGGHRRGERRQRA